MTMTTFDSAMAAITRRQILRGVASLGLGTFAVSRVGRDGVTAQEVTCPPAASPVADIGTPEPMSGQTIGISVGAVRKHYGRAKARLRDLLLESEGNYGIEWRRQKNPNVVL